MENWQKSRNYRRIKGKNGDVVANIITVDGMDVEVTEEVFLAYSQADRHECYQDEQKGKHAQVSLELLTSHDVPFDLYTQRHEISAEDSAIQREEYAEFISYKNYLSSALDSLSIKDQALIQALFFDGLSTRAYAKELGVTQRAIVKRRDRVLRELKKFFDEKQS